MQSSETATSQPSGPTAVVRVYAAELDDATCQTCAAHAGLEYRSTDPRAPRIPNPACTCEHGCRCEWL